MRVIRNQFPDDDRKTNGHLIASGYESWLTAQNLCEYLEKKGKIISSEFEYENDPLIWHGCTFTINGNVDFETEEVKALSSMIKCFDSLTVIVEDENISCAATKRMYENPAAPAREI